MNIFKLWKNNLFPVGLILIGLTVFLMSREPEGALSKGVLFLTGGLQTISLQLKTGVSDTVKKYLFLLSVREESALLLRENTKLKTENQQLKELERENRELNRLLGFSKQEQSSLLAGRVIATDLFAQNRMFVIDRGSRHGVQKYMGVVCPKGVVGYVFRVSPFSSQVVTLFNRLSSLPVINRRSRLKGLTEAGLKSKTLFLKYFDLQEYGTPDLKEGDEIVTEETEQFPSGFPVGTVHSIKKNTEDFRQEVLVKPHISFTAVERVFVILKPRNSQAGL